MISFPFVYMNRILTYKTEKSLCQIQHLQRAKNFRGTTFFHFFPYGEKPYGTQSCPLRCNGRSRRPYSKTSRCSRRGSRKEFTRGSWPSFHHRQLSAHESSDLLVSGHRRFSPIIIDCREFVKGFCEFFEDFREKDSWKTDVIRRSRLFIPGKSRILASFVVLPKKTSPN